MKRISTLLIFQFICLSIFCQNYIEISHTSGITNNSFSASLESAATKVNQAIPSSENIDFKILDFGYYIHVDKIKDASETLWNEAVAEAETLAPFYLLIAKETERVSLYTTFMVKLKMPSTGMFACMDEVKRKMMELQIEIAINNKFESLDGTPNDYPLAEIEGMDILENYFKNYSNCCVNGTYSTNCDACTFSNEEMASYLSSQGYLTYKNAIVTTSTQQYNGLLDSPVNIDLEIEGNKVKFTEELDWFLNGASDLGTTKARVKVFDFNNCETFKDFESLSIGSEVYVEDIVVINKNGETLFFYKIHENLIGNPILLRSSAGKPAAIPVVVVWLLKRAAMAGVGVLTHITTEIVFEKWLGGHETWWIAWEAVDLKFWEVIVAGAEGFVGGDLEKVQLLWNIGTQIGEYLYSTPYEEVTFIGVFSHGVLGAIQGVLNIYADKLDFTKYLNKFGPDIVVRNLEDLGFSSIFFKARSFRKTFIQIVWNKANQFDRGWLIESVLQFSTFKNGWERIGQSNGPVDFFSENPRFISQVKSVLDFDPDVNWANVRDTHIKKGCESLIQGLNINQFAGSEIRLDIVIPESQMIHKDAMYEKIYNYIQNRYGPRGTNPNNDIMNMLSRERIYIGTYLE